MYLHNFCGVIAEDFDRLDRNLILPPLQVFVGRANQRQGAIAKHL